MALELSIKTLVVAALSLIGILLGLLLINQISNIKDIIPKSQFGEENFYLEVEPANSQVGTVFLLRGEFEKIDETENLEINIKGEQRIDQVNLFDDGKHFDFEKGDGIYAGFFDSSGKTPGSYQVLKDDQALASFDIYSPGCNLIDGKPGKNKIKFVFVPSGYQDYLSFEKDVKKILSLDSGILSIEPFSSKKDEFSFLAVDSKGVRCNVGCNGQPSFVCCNDKQVYEEASRCNFDSILVLVNDNNLCGQAGSYAKICAGHEKAGLVATHEIGHSFADLADEYVYEDIYGHYQIEFSEAPNCAEAGCNKWSTIGEGCFEGCTENSLYRPTETSIMRDAGVPWFNIVSENQINSIIKNYAVSRIETEKSFYVGLEYNNEEIEIDSVAIKPVSPVITNQKTDYTYSIKDGNEIEIASGYVFIPIIERQLEGFENSPIINQRVRTSLILPFRANAKSIQILKNNEVLSSADLALLTSSCGNNICEYGENHVSCSIDCSQNEDDLCEYSDTCDPDCENCGLAKNNKKLIGFSLIIICLITLVIVFLKARKK